MQEIGPFKLTPMEGHDTKWFDTLLAYVRYGHAALLVHCFGQGASTLVRAE